MCMSSWIFDGEMHYRNLHSQWAPAPIQSTSLTLIRPWSGQSVPLPILNESTPRVCWRTAEMLLKLGWKHADFEYVVFVAQSLCLEHIRLNFHMLRGELSVWKHLSVFVSWLTVTTDCDGSLKLPVAEADGLLCHYWQLWKSSCILMKYSSRIFITNGNLIHPPPPHPVRAQMKTAEYLRVLIEFSHHHIFKWCIKV